MFYLVCCAQRRPLAIYRPLTPLPVRARSQSGAKINISDGSCPERIVTVTGSTDAIFKSFQLITKKLEEVMERNQNEYGVSTE